jgi:hypothetical protein
LTPSGKAADAPLDHFANNLMSRNERLFDHRQISLGNARIRPADSTRYYSRQHVAVAHNRALHFRDFKGSAHRRRGRFVKSRLSS